MLSDEELKKKIIMFRDTLLFDADQGFWVSTVIRFVQDQRKATILDTFLELEARDVLPRDVSEADILEWMEQPK